MWATLRRWRAHFTAAGLGDPFLVMAQGFGDTDPRRYGFDAAAEFPPHKVGWKGPDLAASVRRFARDYAGTVLSYDHMVRTAMRVEEADFTLFRGVCPGWDNEARRPNQGVSLVNATPAKYGEWLAWACRSVLRANAAEERIVFINAWNEWAEGAHLEPDRHFGYAYLQATAEALAGLAAAVPACPPIGAADVDLLPMQMNLPARVAAPLRRLCRPFLARLAPSLRRLLHSGR